MSSSIAKTILNITQCAARIKLDITIDGNGRFRRLNKLDCELCGKQDDDKGSGSRFIPRRSSVNNNFSNIQVHIGYAILSPVVVFSFSYGVVIMLSRWRVFLIVKEK